MYKCPNAEDISAGCGLVTWLKCNNPCITRMCSCSCKIILFNILFCEGYESLYLKGKKNFFSRHYAHYHCILF